MAVRKIKQNELSLTGNFFSSKMNSEVEFESSLERDFFYWCEFKTSVESYVYQPLSLEYTCEKGIKRIYTPDVLVEFRDSRETWLVEVKYKKDFVVSLKENKAKYKAAIKYCVERGWKFHVIDESIRTPLLDNIKFLLNFYGKQIDEETKQLMIIHMKKMGEFSPNSFINSFAKTDYIRGIMIRYFWVLTCQREIVTDLRIPLTMDSIFQLSEAYYEKY